MGIIKKIQIALAQARIKDNVEYRKKHCDSCAAWIDQGGNPFDEKGHLLPISQRPGDCAERGTFHGEDVAMFQPYSFVSKLIREGHISPHHPKNLFFGYNAKQFRVANGITNAGRAIVSGLLNGSGTPAAFTFVAVGTDTTAFSTSDTALGAESATAGLTRAAGSVSIVTTTITNDTAQVLKSFSVTGTVAVTEAGLFNASSGATLLARQTFSAVNVVNGDTLQVTWKIKNA